MSGSFHATAVGNGTDVAVDALSSTKALRTLYYLRFGFAIVWVLLIMASGSY